MAATVQGILLYGDHASRPAATAPPVGSVYSCSDHALVYTTDGATWTTWFSAAAVLDFGESGDIVASAPGDTVAAGATGEIADAGHRHAREAMGGTGDMSGSAVGDTVAAGATGKVSDAGHRHAREAFATPAIVLGTAAAAGAATTPIRSDATIAAFDATNPSTQAYSDAPSPGVAAVAARRDHVHGMPASGGTSFATPAIVLGTAAAAGSSGDAIRADSTIVAFDATSPAASAPGDAATVGAAAVAARRDHKHARTTERVLYEFVIDGGGSAITTGVKGFLYVPDAFTITGVVMGADQSGSIVVDLWVDSYANYPPTVADTITASAKPTISSTTKSKDTTLTGWTTAVAADRWIGFNVDSITTCQRVTVAIFGYRS